MIQKLLSLSVLLFCLPACGQEAPSTQNAVEVGEKEWKKAESGKPSDELAANAVPDSDVAAKVRYSLTAVQEAYKAADGIVPGIGKVTLLVDENLTLIIKNEFQGKIYETRADVKSLDPDASHINVIVDENPGEFPGIQIPVLSGKSKVFKMEDGNVKSKEDYLEIKLADRPSIERIAAAMLNAIQSAHGMN